MKTTVTDWLNGLRQLVSGPKSLERSLALTVGGLLLAAILVLAFSAVGLLRKQAEQQALSRVQLAGISAREAVRRVGEDTLTAARVLAARPSLPLLIREGNREQLELFLRRSCETSGMSACAIMVGRATVLASTRPNLSWDGPARAHGGAGRTLHARAGRRARWPARCAVADSGLVDTRVVVVNLFDARLAKRLGEETGLEVRLVRLSQWLDNVEPPLKALHSNALSSGSMAAAAHPASWISSRRAP